MAGEGYGGFPSVLDEAGLPFDLSGWATKGNRIPTSSGGGGAAAAGGAGELATGGLVLGIGGALVSAVGAFYSAQSAKYEAKSRALDLEFEQSMANLSARAAEREAQSILEAGQREAGQATLRAGAAKAADEASRAAAGVELGQGSAAEISASHDLAREIDAMTIDLNAVRGANAARTQAVNYENQGRLAGVGARNARRTARSINPAAAVLSSLLSSAGQVAPQWYNYSRRS